MKCNKYRKYEKNQTNFGAEECSDLTEEFNRELQLQANQAYERIYELKDR